MASGEAPRERTYQGIRTGGRSERVRAAVVAAAIEEMVGVGYAELSLAQVATRADVALTTVHRRWESKAALLTDVIEELLGEAIAVPDLGSVELDFHAVVSAAAAALRDPVVVASFRTIMLLQPRERARVQARIDALAADLAEAVVGRAIERGELAPNIDRRRVVELLFAGIWMRSFVAGLPINERAIDTFAADALAAARGLVAA